jgi:hypothetical protein
VTTIFLGFSMSHLVSPLRDLSLKDGLRALTQAHEFIAEQAVGRLASEIGKATAVTETWGCDFKRIDIPFPPGHARRQFTDSDGRVHVLVEEDVRPQKLIEVINQAATIERLMDALRWAMSGPSGLNGFTIRLCHPTTSSEADEDEISDHDLVLAHQTGATAIFEVSDVASPKDGNGKAEKDLRSLGVLVEGKGEEKFRVRDWPASRLFLVVSSDWKEPLRARRRKWVQNRTVEGRQIPPHLILTPIRWESPTGIFEIGRGEGFGRSPALPSLIQESANR